MAQAAKSYISQNPKYCEDISYWLVFKDIKPCGLFNAKSCFIYIYICMYV